MMQFTGKCDVIVTKVSKKYVSVLFCLKKDLPHQIPNARHEQSHIESISPALLFRENASVKIINRYKRSVR